MAFPVLTLSGNKGETHTCVCVWGGAEGFINIYEQTLKTYPLVGHHRGKPAESTSFEMLSFCQSFVLFHWHQC